MQVVKKAALFLLVILFSLAIFAPKRELYYPLEEKLLQHGIIIDNEEVDSGLFTLKLHHPEIYIKGIKVAEISEISLLTLLVYTSIKAEEIKVDSSLRRLLPGEIGVATARYQILDPKRVTLKVSGTFGRAEGYLSLDSRVLHLDLLEEKSIGELKAMLKKGDKGWYYETSF